MASAFLQSSVRSRVTGSAVTGLRARCLSTAPPVGVAVASAQKVYESSQAALHDLKDGQSM